MEALINRIPFLPLLIATGFFLFGGTTLHAQLQSPLKTTPDGAVAVPPAADEGDTTVTPENESELRDVNSTSDPDLESAIADHEQLREDFELYKFHQEERFRERRHSEGPDQSCDRAASQQGL